MKLSTRDITFVSLFVALITIGAKITIPSPIVPFSMQFMFVVLAGMFLGSRLGFISMIVYIALGLIGVPVFAKGGGIAYLFSPTFGYLIGFAAAAYIIGALTERQESDSSSHQLSFVKAFGINILGLLVVYTLGVGYMFIVKNFYLGSALTISKAIWYGAVLFVPSDLLFCAVCAAIGIKVSSRVRAIIG